MCVRAYEDSSYLRYDQFLAFATATGGDGWMKEAPLRVATLLLARRCAAVTCLVSGEDAAYAATPR